MKVTTSTNSRSLLARSIGAALSIGLASTLAQETPSAGGTVSKAEYDKLLSEQQAMKKEMAEMKAQMSALTKMQGSILSSSSGGSSGKETPAADAAALAQLQSEVDELKGKVKESFPGSTKFLLAGYGAAGFTAQHGHDAFFTASFNPIFLWKLSDRLLFEGEIELELEGGETHVALEIAQASYILNDYMTLGFGKFLTPMNSFVERQHMAWVNKLPDKPLAVYDGLLPESVLGVQLRGAIPIGPTLIEWAAYVANAPKLVMSPDGDDFAPLGTLDFDNFDNSDGHIALGGHVGFLPIPQLEIGYGVQHSSVGPRNDKVDATLQSADLNVVDDSELLKGVINFRAQYVWSQVGRFTYDALAEEGFGPLTFTNKRQGGYVQLSYRPSRVENFLKDFEAVARYDRLDQHKTPVGFDEERWTFGLNYWINPSTVLKAAYEFDTKHGAPEKQNAVLVQAAVGF